MRFIDVMLRKTDPRQQVLVGLAADERRRVMLQMGEHAAALRALVASDGWKILKEELLDDETSILAGMEQSTTDATTNRLVGALLSIKSTMAWPEQTATELERSIVEANENE